MTRYLRRPYFACLAQVSGSSPPGRWLDELVDWALLAPEGIFIGSGPDDIYTSVFSQLGPYADTEHRRAVMLEVLRVLAGLESTWRWNAGVHTTKSTPKTEKNEEAGAFQVSADSMDLDPSLKTYVKNMIGKTDSKTFINSTKTNHKFATEYAARLLRISTQHNGPIKRREVHSLLQRDAVSEFQSYLTEYAVL